MRRHDPIVAIASAAGRGAIGIVRVSGNALGALAQALCGRALQPRMATYLAFRDARGQPIDQGLALYFPGPHSYTGEDVLELQAHGGPVVLQLLLARCLEAGAGADPATGRPCLPGLRLAQPGEFTERAFLNDKIDLAQAEAIADLIDASTEAAARSASRSLSGAFSAGIHGLRDALIALRTLVEASLDFPEEETDFLHQADARGQLSRLRQALGAVLQQARQGALLRDGIEVVIAGQPNAGKSSLLNALAGAELAIVTPVAGTTRDKVQQTIQIEGVPLHIIDTAGLRASDDEVERIGIARSWEAMAAADAVLFLHDLARAQTPKYIADDAEIERALARKLPPGVAVIDVWNKLDCVAAPTELAAPTESAAAPPASARPAPTPRRTVQLSARTGQGLDGLRRILLEVAGWQSVPEGICIARARHVQALQMAAAHLEQAADQLQARGAALELLAEELRLAQNALDSITGAFTSDDLLGAIFARFCIGK
ncbi:tRNA uridine-5-carboxymethylaminomethyl(34) synthesis GTPase MnmE [Verminephrobacter eiseniae]|uniref:tRNA uridine-5-carboxymethylaminomethyl(34) synthesis GTPase MnmE n=1 Tax=Verminephrobacter eiseniae TaxID=364317 RepID=UPI002236FBE5|nr:tRNA uridine-5-carboxymethylaminomethyl(34) synthesis GTPase MnmE [Verminephrobacter eiseniae]MCW5286170.1 tRNA uridine-5-carboxymethylaminomethyl(34) synthesis GTPase MnmE [Verminephrobacter eiseniae]MCW5304469.1 tRNA uridine-5-carboxymethylaminomethyl(34) synthesis GTPase MnmE [Verminephrobacter eiseniae]MCW8192054.1 tRNA uridine-5-carboxymethylaminomethyl(34) synthesis GTPase MnmE [Verminephrobacter eiseniae]